jgi:hypothetical protein
MGSQSEDKRHDLMTIVATRHPEIGQAALTLVHTIDARTW